MKLTAAKAMKKLILCILFLSALNPVYCVELRCASPSSASDCSDQLAKAKLPNPVDFMQLVNQQNTQIQLPNPVDFTQLINQQNTQIQVPNPVDSMQDDYENSVYPMEQAKVNFFNFFQMLEERVKYLIECETKVETTIPYKEFLKRLWVGFIKGSKESFLATKQPRALYEGIFNYHNDPHPMENMGNGIDCIGDALYHNRALMVYKLNELFVYMLNKEEFGSLKYKAVEKYQEEVRDNIEWFAQQYDKSSNKKGDDAVSHLDKMHDLFSDGNFKYLLQQEQEKWITDKITDHLILLDDALMHFSGKMSKDWKDVNYQIRAITQAADDIDMRFSKGSPLEKKSFSRSFRKDNLATDLEPTLKRKKRSASQDFNG